MVEYKEMTPETEKQTREYLAKYSFRADGSIIKDDILKRNGLAVILNLSKQIPELTETEALLLLFLGLGAEELNDPLIMERLKDSEQRAAILKAASNLSEHDEQKAAESGNKFRYLLDKIEFNDNNSYLYDKPLPATFKILTDVINRARDQLFGRKPEEYEKPFTVEYTHNGKKIKILCLVNKPLTIIHQEIFTALGDLYENGDKEISINRLWGQLQHDGSPSTIRKQDLENAVDYMMGVVVKINNMDEKKAGLHYPVYKWDKAYQLIQAHRAPKDYKGRDVSTIYLDGLPILYEFGYKRKHFIEIPRHCFKDVTSFTELDKTLENVIGGRVHHIKNDYDKYYKALDNHPAKEPAQPENRISLHHIYEESGIPARAKPGTTPAEKQKYKRRRERAKKLTPGILKALEDNGVIRLYKPYYKESATGKKKIAGYQVFF